MGANLMWVTILGLVGPLLVQLAQGCGKDPRSAALDAYDPDTDSFDEPVVRQAMLQVHTAIKIARRDMNHSQRVESRRITRDDIREKAIAKLREGLTATPEAVAACAAQIPTLPELDGND